MIVCTIISLNPLGWNKCVKGEDSDGGMIPMILQCVVWVVNQLDQIVQITTNYNYL